jgi:hypothetical protein
LKLVLIVIAVVAAWLRWSYDFNDYFSPDEVVARGVVGALDYPRQWDTSWEHGDVTPVYRYPQYNYSSYHYLLYWWMRLAPKTGIFDLAHGRSLNAALGGVAVFCVGIAALRIAGPFASLAAALWVAMIPLLVQDAHYLRCEPMLTAGCAMILWLMSAIQLLSAPRAFFAGVILGWLVAAKPPAGLIVVYPLVMLCQLGRDTGKYSRVFKLLALLLAGAVIGFLLGVPYAFVRPIAYVVGMLVLQKQYSAPLPPFTTSDLSASWPMAAQYIWATSGSIFCFFTLWGYCSYLRRCAYQAAGLLLVPLLAFLLFGSHAVFTERSYSPFAPMVAIAFGVGFASVARYFATVVRYPVVQPALCGLALVASLYVPFRLTKAMVFEGFSGREKESQVRFVDQIQQLNPGLKCLNTALCKPSELEALMTLAQNSRPFWIVVSDYNDCTTAEALEQVRQMPGVREIGRRDGLFSMLPVCSLHTNISPRAWCFLFETLPESADNRSTGLP